MPYIPREFIQQLADGADILAVVGAGVSLKKRGANYVGLCPFHSEKTPSFNVSPQKGFFYCFGCGASGSALDFIVRQNGGDFVAGVESLAAMQGLQVPREGKDGEAPEYPGVGEVLRAAVRHWRANLGKSEKARAYLQKRGMQAQTAKEFLFGYAEDSFDDLTGALKSYGAKTLVEAGVVREKEGRIYDYFRGRIMFPVFDRRGKVCGFAGRALSEEEPAKYLNSPESRRFAKRHLLYASRGIAAAAREKGRVFIAEGYLDVARLWQEGFAESAATMGTAATAPQMRAALRMANKVIFAFDGDKAGRQAAARALEGLLPALRDGDSAHFLFLPDGEDPDSYIAKNGADAFAKLADGAAPLGDFIEGHLWRNVKDGDEGRISAVLAAGQKLIRMLSPERAPYLRALLEKRISERANLSREVFQKAMKREQSRPRRSPDAAGKQFYKMQPQNKLYILLCCLQAQPQLREVLRESPPPLPGDDAAAVAAAAAVLHRLRREEENGESGGGNDITVTEILREEGFDSLSAQIASGARRRFAKGADADAEFNSIIAALRREHEKRVGASKKEWLDKMSSDGFPPQPPPSKMGGGNDAGVGLRVGVDAGGYAFPRWSVGTRG